LTAGLPRRAKPQSTWDLLFSGGGWGARPPDPATGYNCLMAPSFNVRYDQGGEGELLLLKDKGTLHKR